MFAETFLKFFCSLIPNPSYLNIFEIYQKLKLLILKFFNYRKKDFFADSANVQIRMILKFTSEKQIKAPKIMK